MVTVKSSPSIEVHDRIPVKAHYDVIVIGGGVAGVAAAMAASKRGKSVLLIEKSIMLGRENAVGLH